MPLPTNNSRPAIPYVPAQVLPNYNRYQSLGQFPPTAQQLDGDLNAIMDFINTLSDAINNTAAGIFPGANNPLNASKLPTTDGAGNISWTFINAANLDVNAVQTRHIQDQAITTPKIQVQAVGTNQIAQGAVLSGNIGVGAIIGNNIANYTIPLLKLSLPNAQACIIGSTTANGGSVYYQTLSPWLVPTGRPQDYGVTGQTLDVIWANTAGTFDGSKITPASINGASAIISNSTPLGVMKSAGTATSVVCGRMTDQKFTEINLGDLQVISKYTNATTPSAMNLSTIFNNEAGMPYNGSQITAGSLPVTALQNAGQVAPFSMAYVLQNGTIQKSLNIASVTRTGTGTYNVLFNTAANDNKYIVTFGMQGANNYYLNAEVVQNSCTVNGFSVNTGYNQSTVDGEFYFVVYAF